jgi:hypothetical protein
MQPEEKPEPQTKTVDLKPSGLTSSPNCRGGAYGVAEILGFGDVKFDEHGKDGE